VIIGLKDNHASTIFFRERDRFILKQNKSKYYLNKKKIIISPLITMFNNYVDINLSIYKKRVDELEDVHFQFFGRQ